MKINNIILVLRTRIILLSSFVIYFFCMCHSGRFPIVAFATKTVYKLAGYLSILNSSKLTNDNSLLLETL